MPDRSPAFQFYPKDFLSDSRQAAMSLQEVGAYIRLLCVCWNDGSLPSEIDRLARIVGATSGHMTKLWPAISACFTASSDDPRRLVHGRLEKERRKQENFRRRQSDNGRRGGRPGNPTLSSGLSQTKATGNPTLSSGLTQTEPKKSSPISDLQSPDSSPVRTERVPIARAREVSPGEHPELSERAGRFLERYGVLHEKWRHGAVYMGRIHVDFDEALQLVAKFDDERLDKLITVFFNADSEFAEKGTRSVPKFRSMVSWCDERLREKGL